MPLAIQGHYCRRCKVAISLKILKRRFSHDILPEGLSGKNIQVSVAFKVTRISLKAEDRKTEGRNEAFAHDDVAERVNQRGSSGECE